MNNEAEALKKDPRIAEAKKILQQAVKDHQQGIEGVCPPNPALKEQYAKMLSEFADLRGAKLYYPYIGSGFGKGALVELADGSVKYDFIAGIGPHYFGHNHPDILDASIDAALSNTTMQGHLQQNADSLEFIKLLINQSKLDHCFLTSSGAMANENALKIAFQNKHPACRILAFERCFVGRSLAVSHITDKPGFREGLPTYYHVDYVPFFDPTKPEESTKQAVSTLKKHLQRYPKQHAIMCFELVQGEGGFYWGTKEFFVELMTILKDNQIIVFDDEVQCFGRTPELFAFQYFGLDQFVDIVSVGKLSQVCATLFRKNLAPRSGLLSQTFTGSSTAIKVGNTIIESLLNNGYFGEKGKIQEIHKYFVNRLQQIADRHPDLLKGPFGIGSMIAFTPLDGDNQKVTQFVQKLFEAGVMSFVAGSNPTRVRFLLPIGAITKKDIDSACEILETTLVNWRPE